MWSRRRSSTSGDSGSASSRPPRNGESREVAQHRAVPGQQQLLGIVLAEDAGLHLRLEVGDAAVPHRPHDGGEVDAEVGPGVDRLAAHQAHVFVVVGEEVETGADDQLDLRPAGLRLSMAPAKTLEPVAEQPLEDLVVQRFLGREVVQQAGPADADAGGDVVERGAVVARFGEAVQRLGDDLIAGRDVFAVGVGHRAPAYPSRLPTSR